jgi:transposase
MASRSPLQLSEDDLRVLAADRYEHPDPRVQRRLEVIWLISQGETPARAGQLGGVSKATVERYVALYRKGGVAALRTFDLVTPKSELEKHRLVRKAEQKARNKRMAGLKDRLDAILAGKKKGYGDYCSDLTAEEKAELIALIQPS